MPKSRVFSFRDPNAYQTTIRAAEAEVLPTAKGEFQGELIQINLNKLWMQRAREKLPRIIHYAPSPERMPVIFAGTSNAAIIHHDGKELPADAILVDGADTEHHHRSSGPCDLGAMSLPPEELFKAGLTIAGHDLSARSGMHVLRMPLELSSRLRKLHADATLVAKQNPDLLSSPGVARALEHDLIYLMVRCLTESTPVRIGASHRLRSIVITRFKDFLAANNDKPLYLSDMCAATGASERTLRNCCQDHFGMGPMRYLWLRRMRLAHSALLLATPETTTVTRIATEHGFWELGRFATEYRTMFGEVPSTTLRRPPGLQGDKDASIEHRLRAI